MDREDMNQKLRNSDQVKVAVTGLDPEIYEHVEKYFDGMIGVPGIDLIQGYEKAADLLLSRVADPSQFAVATTPELAKAFVLSLYLVPVRQPSLTSPESSAQGGSELKAIVRAHEDAMRVFNVIVSTSVVAPTFESYCQALTICDDAAYVQKLLFRQVDSTAKVTTSTGQVLRLTSKPPRELPSDEIHRVRSRVHNVDSEEGIARVTLEWSSNPYAVAVTELLGRKVSLRFDANNDEKVVKLLQLSATTDVPVEMDVSIVRALEKFDPKIDRLILANVVETKKSQQLIFKRLRKIKADYFRPAMRGNPQQPLFPEI
jgi:hypothetical protein